MSESIFVLSDLHMGAGHWDGRNALEDFTSDEAFAALVDSLIVESQARNLPMEIIFAGDTFEFLQVPSLPSPEAYDPAGHYPSSLFSTSAESDSARKMRIIAHHHPIFFDALGRFLCEIPPRRTVSIVKGNHDVSLHWGAVQDEIRRALKAETLRADCLSFSERGVKRPGLYVEHGNQYTESINRFPDFQEPHDPDDPQQLYLPTGSRFVTEFFNDIEMQRFWIDAVKPLPALIWYLMIYDTALALSALALLLSRAPGILWGSLASMKSALTRLEAAQSLRYQIESRPEGIDLSPPEMEALMVRAESALTPYMGLPVKAESRAGKPTRSTAAARAMETEEAQRSALAEVAGQRAVQEDAQVVVFGHTHHAVQVPLDGDGVYVNTGTWTWVRDFQGDDRATWRRLIRNPKAYADQRQLNYARVDYNDAGRISARLLEWADPEAKAHRGLLARLFGR